MECRGRAGLEEQGYECTCAPGIMCRAAEVYRAHEEHQQELSPVPSAACSRDEDKNYLRETGVLCNRSGESGPEEIFIIISHLK